MMNLKSDHQPTLVTPTLHAQKTRLMTISEGSFHVQSQATLREALSEDTITLLLIFKTPKNVQFRLEVIILISCPPTVSISPYQPLTSSFLFFNIRQLHVRYLTPPCPLAPAVPDRPPNRSHSRGVDNILLSPRLVRSMYRLGHKGSGTGTNSEASTWTFQLASKRTDTNYQLVTNSMRSLCHVVTCKEAGLRLFTAVL
jgi:hypothetical protein